MEKKKPDLRLKALYVTPAGSQTLKVQPKKDTITIEGGMSWRIVEGSLFPKGGDFDVILPYNSSVALPWSSAPLPSPEAYDEALSNSYKEQVDKTAKGAGNPKRVAWLNLGLNVITIITVIIGAVVVSGQIDDLFSLVHQLHQAAPAGGDVTTYNPGASP